MRPRCSVLTDGFDFSGCGDCPSCPPFEHTEMSNSEPSAIVLQGIPCMCGIYKVSIRMAKRRSVYQGGKAVSRANWPRTQKAESALSGVRRPGEPNVPPPLERISDPQIPLTRQNRQHRTGKSQGQVHISMATVSSQIP